jgi:hypothetical protein
MFQAPRLLARRKSELKVIVVNHTALRPG